MTGAGKNRSATPVSSKPYQTLEVGLDGEFSSFYFVLLFSCLVVKKLDLLIFQTKFSNLLIAANSKARCPKIEFGKLIRLFELSDEFKSYAIRVVPWDRPWFVYLSLNVLIFEMQLLIFDKSSRLSIDSC